MTTMAILAPDFDIISTIVRERSAIVLEPGKEYLVESRLAPIAQAHGLKDLHQLAAAMKAAPNGPIVHDVVDAMTTNETSFFRDIRPFEALRTAIIPDLVKARGVERSLTIWCGACSTGQEPYSVAMTLAEHFPELSGWQVKIIGTDLSPTVVKQAERGVYTQLQVNRGVPAPLLVKYFERKGMEWHIKPEIRRRVEFKTANLVASWPSMPTVDLVLLRNVLIYFDNASREQILRRVGGVMAPHGHLLLGSTESTIGLNVPFRREQVGQVSTLRPGAATAAGAPPRPPANQSPSPAGAKPALRTLGTPPTVLAGRQPTTPLPKELRS
jgi:chemotaxis protein methyltransferase CheR